MAYEVMAIYSYGLCSYGLYSYGSIPATHDPPSGYCASSRFQSQPRLHTGPNTHAYTCLRTRLCTGPCTCPVRASPSQARLDARAVLCNFIRHHFIGHHFIGHNYIPAGHVLTNELSQVLM